MLRLRDWPYWALMCLLAAWRFLVRWLFLVFALCGVWVVAESIGASRLPFLDRGSVAVAALAITSGAAWWKTLRNSPRQREWAAAACLVMILTVAADLVMGSSPVGNSWYWAYALGGAMGLAAYLPAQRVRPELEISAYRRGRPEHDWQGAQVWLLAVGRFVGTLTYCLFFVTSTAFVMVHLAVLRDLNPTEVAPAILCLLSGAAWWVTMRNRPRQRIWAIAASLTYVVFVVPVVFMELSERHVRYAAWPVLLIIATGLVAYLVPYRLRYSVNLTSYRLKSPDQPLKEIHGTL
jgi:peptidoglycan/LPS O-acetylase OafA/YrhL